MLSDMDAGGAERMRVLVGDLALDRLRKLSPPAGQGGLRRHGAGHQPAGEGTAVGYNPRKKGHRSCWPLFATVAQTGQALDVLHRPGNVADSTGEVVLFREAGRGLGSGVFLMLLSPSNASILAVCRAGRQGRSQPCSAGFP